MCYNNSHIFRKFEQLVKEGSYSNEEKILV